MDPLEATMAAFLACPPEDRPICPPATYRIPETATITAWPVNE